jgi:quercetin dioxygenase-like cupin family protein
MMNKETTMQTFSTRGLELMESWLGSDPDTSRVRFTFPSNRKTGAEDSAVVYFELEPGKRLPRHTDSAEEIIVVLAGAAEAEVDGERGRLSVGEAALIPALAPHAVANAGDETLRVIGFFSAAEVTSVFEETMEPFGVNVFEQAA